MKRLALLLLLSAPLYAEETKFSALTFDEKMGQTLFAFTDIDNAHRYKTAIQKGLVGGVLIQWGNYSLRQTKKIIKEMQTWAAQSPHKIPLLIAIDYEGGTVYTPVTLGFEFLPTNMMLAAADDDELTARLFYLAGEQLKQTGVHINFAPVADINTNSKNPIVGVRAFGSKEESVTRMSSAVMHGLKASGIMAVAKHFPGHGETDKDSHYTLPVVKLSKEEMRAVHLKPFKKLIDGGVQGVMGAHVVYPAFDAENAATYSKKIIVDLLQKELGFKGVIFTDALDMKGATPAAKGKTAGQIKTEAEYAVALSAAKSIEAGADAALLGWGLGAVAISGHLKKMVGAEVSAARVEEGALKMYNLKRDLGLFKTAEEKLAVDMPAVLKTYLATAEEISQKSVTVLRDKDKKIPFFVKKENGQKQKVCAVFFAPARFSEQLTAFQKPFLTAGWEVDFYNALMAPKAKDYARIKKCMAGADMVALGSLQWAAKTSPSQAEVINKVLAERPDAVLISLLSPFDAASYPAARTVLLNYGISKYSVKASADILLGNIEARGKTPVELE